MFRSIDCYTRKTRNISSDSSYSKHNDQIHKPRIDTASFCTRIYTVLLESDKRNVAKKIDNYKRRLKIYL